VKPLLLTEKDAASIPKILHDLPDGATVLLSAGRYAALRTILFPRAVTLVADGAVVFVGPPDDGIACATGETGSGAVVFRGIAFEEGAGERGGAVEVRGRAVAFEDCRFARNRATVRGGAVLVQESLAQFVRCTFTGNAAPFGGALDLGRGAVAELTDCSFETNSADFGGAVHLGDGGNLVARGCVWGANVAEHAGTALRVVGMFGPSARLEGCVLRGDRAVSAHWPKHGGSRFEVRVKDSVVPWNIFGWDGVVDDGGNTPSLDGPA
jgi:hypothetical protein